MSVSVELLRALGATTTACASGVIVRVESPQKVFAGHEDMAQELFERGAHIVEHGFEVDLRNRDISSIRAHLFDATTLALLVEDGAVNGFASSKEYPELDTFYLYGIVLLSERQGTGAGTALLRGMLAGKRFGHLALTTQNPVMYCAMQKFCKRVWPSPEGESPWFDMDAMRIALLHGRRGTFKQESSVIEDIYASCRYDRIPESRDGKVNRWFTDSLAIDGDRKTSHGFLCIGDLK